MLSTQSVKAAPVPAAAIDGSIESLARAALELVWEHSPVLASIYGVRARDGELPRTDPSSRTDFCWRARDLLGRLEKFSAPGDPLGRAERWALRSLLHVPLVMEQEFSPFTRNPALYLEHTLQGIYGLFMRQSPLEEERGRAVISRLREIPRLLDEAHQNLKPQSTRIPSCWVESALRLTPGGEALIRQAADQLQRELPSLKHDAEAAALAALDRLQVYAEFLRREILPRARGHFALGADLFHFLLREEHHLSYRDVDLLEWGRHEMEETRREMEGMARAISPGRSWREIVEEVQADHPPAGDLVSAYRDQVQRARRFTVDKGLATLPEGEELIVSETPEFERSLVPFAAYVPPPPFGLSRQGTFWVTPPGLHLAEDERRQVLRDHCRARLPITAVHETYPGHHLQFSHLVRQRSAVLRQYTSSVFVEGWALYCEEMMIDQGFLTDPRSRLYQKRDHLWRACRVVLDAGLHTGEIGLEEAQRMLVEEVCLQPPNARAEVTRYTQTPTQPLSYLVGKREIQALRRVVERERRSSFRLAEFHDQILAHGCLPFDFLRDILLAPSPEPAHA